MRSIVIVWANGLALLAAVVIAPIAIAAPPPGARCAAAKLRATGRRALGVLMCRARAVAKGRAPDDACSGRLDAGFVHAIDQADAKGCAVAGNPDVLMQRVADLDGFVADAFAADGSTAGRKCAAAETAATARKAAGAGGCSARAVLAGAADDANCTSAVDKRFRHAFATAVKRLRCGGDAAAVAAHVDAWQAGVVDVVLSGAPTSTTTSTVGPTTSTSTTDTTSSTTETSTTIPTTTTSTTSTTTTTGTTLEGQTTTTTTSTTTTTVTTTTTTHTTTTHTTTTTTTTSSTTTTAPPGTFRAVQQIFTNNCALAGCHVPPSPGQDLDLSSAAVSYGQLVGVASGQKPAVKRVKAADYAKSYLYWKIVNDSRILGSKMPNNGLTLSAADVNSIKQWIVAGAPDN